MRTIIKLNIKPNRYSERQILWKNPVDRGISNFNWKHDFKTHSLFCKTLQLSTTDWHLPRALPKAEQKRHLPSASTETEHHATIAADVQQSLREFRVE